MKQGAFFWLPQLLSLHIIEYMPDNCYKSQRYHKGHKPWTLSITVLAKIPLALKI